MNTQILSSKNFENLNLLYYIELKLNYLNTQFSIDIRKAASVLKLNYLEQQHKRQVEELDLEMKAELEKSKEELNRNLEVTLDNELKVSKYLLTFYSTAECYDCLSHILLK